MSPHSLIRTSVSACLFLLFSIPAAAKALKILSSPPGATVELDGQIVGTTPYEHDYPSGYFERPKTIFQKRLGHSITLRLTLQGYVTEERVVTDGPRNWVDLHNKSHGEFWLFKTDQIVVNLKPLLPSPLAAEHPEALQAKGHQETLSIPAMIARAKTAVVSVGGPNLSGTGFFVSDSGLIATSAHLAGTQQNLIVTLSSGQQISATLAFQDARTDIALIRIQLPATAPSSPYLLLADPASIAPGDPVFAIGYPAAGFPLSVTQGVASQIGSLSGYSDITRIQTDAALNMGNSGGPLLNLRGEVVGIITDKPNAASVSGIGFALSSAHLSAVLKDYHTVRPVSLEKLAAPTSLERGEIDFTEPQHGLVSSNAEYLGQIPMHLSLPPGEYTFVIMPAGQAACIRRVRLLAGAHVTVKGDCFPAP